MLTNLFTDLPAAARRGEAETFDDLLRRPGLRIERIISTGQASPPGFWYCQSEGEWVVLLEGAAGLQLENEEEERVLNVGDFLDIPPRCRHRVNWTSRDKTTVWLAVFYAAVGEITSEK